LFNGYCNAFIHQTNKIIDLSKLVILARETIALPEEYPASDLQLQYVKQYVAGQISLIIL